MKKHIVNILFILILIFVIFDFPFWAYIPIIIIGGITPIQNHLKNLKAIKTVKSYCILSHPIKSILTLHFISIFILVGVAVLLYYFKPFEWLNTPKYHSKLTTFTIVYSLIQMIQSFGSKKNWFIETLRIYGHGIQLPGKESQQIPWASISSINRDERNITLDFIDRSSFSSNIEEGSIRNFDKLIEIWQNNHSG